MFGCRTRSAGILLGWLADLVIADPARGHPVSGFGTAAGALERVTYRDSRWAGALHTGLLVGGVAAFECVLRRALRPAGWWGRVGLVALATWTACGGTTLTRTGTAMVDQLQRGDTPGARRLLPSLCGRDPDALDADGLIRAALESIAENTSDAQVAPLLLVGLGGAPPALVYRAVNTLDAMVGYRSPRYDQFGWAAARLDDLVNLVPARVTGALTVLCAPVVGGSPAGAVRAWRRDAGRHPSPNAGVVEAAFAGALGVRLGGRTQYAHGVQIRPTLGDGRHPHLGDLRRAVVLSRAVQLAALGLAIGVSGGVRTGRRASRRGLAA